MTFAGGRLTVNAHATKKAVDIHLILRDTVYTVLGENNYKGGQVCISDAVRFTKCTCTTLAKLLKETL